MHIFDYRFLNKEISAEMAGLSNIIYDLRARENIRKESDPAVFKELRKAAMIDSVASSNAIEGIVTTRKRVEEIICNAAPESHDEHAIKGYKDALNEIYQDETNIDLNEKTITHFHYLLLCDTDPKEAGKYKSDNNWIQERDVQGRISVRFVPVTAKETPSAMEQLLMAYREGRQDSRINHLFLTACFVVDFLCIHPFMDGNGRVSRLLTTLLLQKSGFNISRYISVEKKIDEYKYDYYDALKASSEGWHDNENDYRPFIIYLLRIIYACYKDLDTKFLENSLVKIPKNKQVESLVMNSFVPVSKMEIKERLPEVSISTIERVLGKLVRDRKVEKIGTYRNARYRGL